MMKTGLVLSTLLSLAGCGAIDPQAADSQAIGVIHVDENGDYTPPVPKAPLCIRPPVVAVSDGLANRCDTDPSTIPAAYDLATWKSSCTLWAGHSGVILPYCLDPNWNGLSGQDCTRLEIYGVDLGPNVDDVASAIIVFHAVGTWADVQALEWLAGSQHGTCGDDRISAGQLTSGLPPKKPAQQGTGGGGSPTFCLAHEIAANAWLRIRCQ